MTNARTYLDANASEVMRLEARAAMVAALDHVGNPLSVHGEGRRARGLVETAREQVAALVGARPVEVVFTSGATEANNAVVAAGWDDIALSSIEHPSVLAPVEASGARVTRIAAGGDGVVRAEAFADWALVDGALAGSATGSRRLAALQLANNETGVVQPLAEVAHLAAEQGFHLHVDAAQGPGRMAVDFSMRGIASMSLSAHKMGGPKGIGALLVREGSALAPLLRGGGQERRRRAGTENVAAIAGFGAAASAVCADAEAPARMRRLREMLEREVLLLTPDVVVVGAGAERLCNTSCLALAGLVAETLVIQMDLAGIAISAGAACSSGKVGASHVLTAMGLAPDIARAAIRVSLGHASTEADVRAFLAQWARIAASQSSMPRTAATVSRASATRQAQEV